MNINENIDVFKFSSAVEFLKVVGKRYLARRNVPYTLEDWANRLGYRSHTSLVMILSGKRVPSRTMQQRLAKDLGLDARESSYFALLVDLERQRQKGKRLEPIIEALERFNPHLRGALPLDASAFSFIAEWFHLVIKQLIGIADFQENVEWIRARLRGKVTAAEARNALENLLRLGYLTRAAATDRLVAAVPSIDTVADLPSSAGRMHLRQMLERAKEALTEQSVETREFSALTLQFDPRDLPAAKQMIREFRREFDRRFLSVQGSCVYQLNLQFFNHTV